MAMLVIEPRIPGLCNQCSELILVER